MQKLSFFQPMQICIGIAIMLTQMSCSDSSNSTTDRAADSSKSAGKLTSADTSSALTAAEVLKLARQKFEAYMPTIESKNKTSIGNWKSYNGDFNNDGKPDAIVFFFQTPPTGGNMDMGSGLVFYQNSEGDAKVVAGFEPDYPFSYSRTENGKVTIVESIYKPEDSPCCPSQAQDHELTINGDKVTDVKTGSVKKVPPPPAGT